MGTEISWTLISSHEDYAVNVFSYLVSVMEQLNCGGKISIVWTAVELWGSDSERSCPSSTACHEMWVPEGGGSHVPSLDS